MPPISFTTISPYLKMLHVPAETEAGMPENWTEVPLSFPTQTDPKKEGGGALKHCPMSSPHQRPAGQPSPGCKGNEGGGADSADHPQTKFQKCNAPPPAFWKPQLAHCHIAPPPLFILGGGPPPSPIRPSFIPKGSFSAFFSCLWPLP